MPFGDNYENNSRFPGNTVRFQPFTGGFDGQPNGVRQSGKSPGHIGFSVQKPRFLNIKSGIYLLVFMIKLHERNNGRSSYKPP